MANHMYLEEMDGQRSIIVTDGNYGWWSDPCEDGTFCGVNLYDGTMEKVAERIRGVVDFPHAIKPIVIEAFKTEDRRNPAWDHFLTLDEAEESELRVIDQDLPWSYVEI